MRLNAASLFRRCSRSSAEYPTAPDGGWVILTAVCRLFLFWPPAPPVLAIHSTRQSLIVTLKSLKRVINGPSCCSITVPAQIALFVRSLALPTAFTACHIYNLSTYC